jgi:hypothetical protein
MYPVYSEFPPPGGRNIRDDGRERRCFAMRKRWVLGIVGAFALFLAGCGGGSSGPVVAVQDIVSMGGADDGYIGLDSLGYYTVFSSVSPYTIVVSDDPADNRRGFVSFSISSIPDGASIQSAFIYLPVLRATPVPGVSSVTLLVDMVSFPSLDRLGSQGELQSVYSTTPILEGPSLSVFPGDAGGDKVFDATDAFLEAQRLGFSVLQIRLIGISGEVVIDDLLDEFGYGTPLLRVEYF